MQISQREDNDRSFMRTLYVRCQDYTLTFKFLSGCPSQPLCPAVLSFWVLFFPDLFKMPTFVVTSASSSSCAELRHTSGSLFTWLNHHLMIFYFLSFFFQLLFRVHCSRSSPPIPASSSITPTLCTSSYYMNS